MHCEFSLLIKVWMYFFGKIQYELCKQLRLITTYIDKNYELLQDLKSSRNYTLPLSSKNQMVHGDSLHVTTQTARRQQYIQFPIFPIPNEHIRSAWFEKSPTFISSWKIINFLKDRPKFIHTHTYIHVCTYIHLYSFFVLPKADFNWRKN